MALPIRLKLPDRFLEEEVRCGFTVSEKLKKIWAVELDLLNELMRVCKKHDIKMQVSYGTLLGAVRHKGFIPWDDDLDVWLPRDEYNKLLKIASSEFTHPYFFQTALSDRKYFFQYARLRNSMTTGIIAGRASPDYNNGIYIDIYVIDGFTQSPLLFYPQLFFRRIMIKCLTLYCQEGMEKGSGLLGFVLFRMIRPVVRLFKYEFLFALNNKFISLYNKMTDRLSVVYEMLRTPYSHWITRAEWGDSITLPFENISVPVPRAYHQILTRMYGDYMTYPSPEERGTWHEGILRFEPDIPYKEYLQQGKC